MKVYYIIDQDGYFIEPVFLIKQEGVDYSKHIEIEPIGFKRPKWDGTEWTEGGIDNDN